MLRKIVGFLVGFIGSFLLLVVIFHNLEIRPVGGPLWLMPMVAAGAAVARLFSHPRSVIASSVVRVSNSTAGFRVGAKNIWWSFDSKFRLVVVISVVWILTAYLIQDSYDMNYKIIWLPAFAFMALYVGLRFLVERKS
ncbi:MAG: hypothetical protein VB050_00805 [Geobacteraceae bacterium]|nr:hypothetical protein [Geobacteraceae bacterium]